MSTATVGEFFYTVLFNGYSGNAIDLGGTALSSPVTLSISGTVSAVPIPASVWLLASGLIGLVAVRRRVTVIRQNIMNVWRDETNGRVFGSSAVFFMQVFVPLFLYSKIRKNVSFGIWRFNDHGAIMMLNAGGETLDGSEKRGESRHRGKPPVELESCKGITRDFNGSSIFFERTALFSPGQPIEFTIVLEHIDPEHPVRLKCQRKIVRVEESGQKIGVAATIDEHTFEGFKLNTHR